MRDSELGNHELFHYECKSSEFGLLYVDIRINKYFIIIPKLIGKHVFG